MVALIRADICEESAAAEYQFSSRRNASFKSMVETGDAPGAAA